MGKISLSSGGLGRVAVACLLAALPAACYDGGAEPAPVFLRGGGGVAMAVPNGQPVPPPPPVAIAPVGPRHIAVAPGQTLDGIARAYQVSPHAIIKANRLRRPYRVLAGMRLVIPDDREPAIRQAALVRPAMAPPHIPPSRRAPEIVPLDAPPRLAAASPVPVASAPPAEQLAAPEPVPALRPPPEPPKAAIAAAPPEPAADARLPHGGRFEWPVQGRVLASYGASSGGHNDGINIAAARGTPVRAVDAGVVAYAGNEVRGYGNLVLVKHSNGWISAYAHCEELLVNAGDKVARGQPIARVGATGGVDEPQLHFELRRGRQAVDPRQFLAPAPSAVRDSAARG